MKFTAFVMDPMDKISPKTDSSFALMLAAQKRGSRLLHVRPDSLELDGAQVWLKGMEVKVCDGVAQYFEMVAPVKVRAEECQAIFIRTDPPFDLSYLNVTWILSFAAKAGVLVVNSPDGIRAANEKLYALNFIDLCPNTIISSDRERIIDVLSSWGGEGIIKPIDGHGGFGVMRLRDQDSNLRAIVDLLTIEGTQPIVLQEYLSEAIDGDKRLILIDGELRGAIQRIPSSGDHRGNVHVGGTVSPVDPDDRDFEIATEMRKQLKQDGLFFVGIDVIAGKLIEVNVTSPTLLREISALGGPNLAQEIIDAVFLTRS